MEVTPSTDVVSSRLTTSLSQGQLVIVIVTCPQNKDDSKKKVRTPLPSTTCGANIATCFVQRNNRGYGYMPENDPRTRAVRRCAALDSANQRDQKRAIPRCCRNHLAAAVCSQINGSLGFSGHRSLMLRTSWLRISLRISWNPLSSAQKCYVTHMANLVSAKARCGLSVSVCMEKSRVFKNHIFVLVICGRKEEQ